MKKYFLRRAERNSLFCTTTRTDLNHTLLNLSNTYRRNRHTTQTRQHNKWAETKTTTWKILQELQRARRNSHQQENVIDCLYAETEGFSFAIHDQVINSKNYY